MMEIPVLATRKLEANPDYEPRYRRAPAASVLELELSEDERELLDGLLATGVYGSTHGEAVRAAFMRWCNQNVTRIRRAFLEFT